jgi:hypothetical protein
MGSTNRRITTVQASPGIKRKLISQITIQKWLAEWLKWSSVCINKFKAQSSILLPQKKNEK